MKRINEREDLNEEETKNEKGKTSTLLARTACASDGRKLLFAKKTPRKTNSLMELHRDGLHQSQALR